MFFCCLAVAYLLSGLSIDLSIYVVELSKCIAGEFNTLSLEKKVGKKCFVMIQVNVNF